MDYSTLIQANKSNFFNNHALPSNLESIEDKISKNNSPIKSELNNCVYR